MHDLPMVFFGPPLLDLAHFVPSTAKWLAAEAATCVFHSQKKQDMQCKRAEGALGTG